jgi:hypothetical protein
MYSIFIQNVYRMREPGGVAAYRKIVGKRTNLHIFLYTGVKVVIAYFIPDRSETPVSVGICIVGCVPFYL